MHCIIIVINCNFTLKLLQYCNYIIIVMKITLILLLLLLLYKLLTHIYFQVHEYFPERVFYHDLPPSLGNRNMYRDDNIHLTKKGNDILVRWMHYKLGGTIKHQLVPPSHPSSFGSFWSENGHTLCRFWSGKGCGFLGNYGSVWA